MTRDGISDEAFTAALVEYQRAASLGAPAALRAAVAAGFRVEAKALADEIETHQRRLHGADHCGFTANQAILRAAELVRAAAGGAG